MSDFIGLNPERESQRKAEAAMKAGQAAVGALLRSTCDELERLRAVNADLLAALEDLLTMRDGPDSYVGDATLAIEVKRARAAIAFARAKGGPL